MLDHDTGYTVYGKSGPWITMINGFSRPRNDFKKYSCPCIQKWLQSFII